MPKPYNRPMPATWWLQSRPYFWFMIRELTAVFVGAYSVVLIIMLWRLKRGRGAAFDDMLAILQSPGSVGLHFIALVFAVYHTVTWFNAVPQAMPVRIGEERVPAPLLILPNYLLWLGVSCLLVWLVVR